VTRDHSLTEIHSAKYKNARGKFPRRGCFRLSPPQSFLTFFTVPAGGKKQKAGKKKRKKSGTLSFRNGTATNGFTAAAEGVRQISRVS